MHSMLSWFTNQTDLISIPSEGVCCSCWQRMTASPAAAAYYQLIY